MLLRDLRKGARLGASAPVRYLVGIGLFGLALTARFALIGILPPKGFPFLTFFPAVLLTAFLSGFGAGMMVSALSIFSAWYWFFDPVGSLAGISRADTIALVFFGAILLVDCLVIHLMNAAMKTASQAQERVRQAALHDTLTGLPNRSLIFEYGRHSLAAAQRNHGNGALLFIDLDRFKPINDLHGHETGDLVLQEIGRRIAACTRQEDMVGRLGGDEFVVILPQLNGDRQRAATVARNLIDRVSRPIQLNGLALALSPSIGISYFPEHASDMNTLVHTADMAMYEAKRSGKATFRFYAPELDRRAEQARRLESRLKSAVKQGALALHYQPVIDVHTGVLAGAEALVRLNDSAGSEVSPSDFIPVAEATGLISDIGEWVLAEVCRQHKSWQSEGLELAIAINVSPIQFRQKHFVDRLNSIIVSSGIDPAKLEIDVTESAVMDGIDEAIRILQEVKALGVKVALDDFGTGYSSLSMLTRLPLDKIKVDQSFVRRVDADAACRAVTAAIITLGRSLNLDVHGEGIESERALHYLREQGCHKAQGFWLSKPLPAPEFAQWCGRLH